MLATQERVSVPFDINLISRLRQIALRGLKQMYLPREHLFAFRLRRTRSGNVLEGQSRRYTAIALIGLAEEPDDVARDVLHGDTPAGVCERLVSDINDVTNLGDVALTLWACRAVGSAAFWRAYERLLALRPGEGSQPTVELAWVVTALSLEASAKHGATVRNEMAQRLHSAFHPRSGLFSHTVGGGGPLLRSHVCCFADIVYPVHALSMYYRASGQDWALSAAKHCARHACEALGPAGQWWWHYDVRTGRVVEGYPVYSVHQDSMAPMALFELAESGGPSHNAAVQRGLEWLERSPEMGGRTLIDEASNVIWRKVARREPNKLTRRVQAAASFVHPALRVPGMDALARPVSVDWEDRPYHLGWILYAWSPARLAMWGLGNGANV